MKRTVGERGLKLQHIMQRRYLGTKKELLIT